MRTVGELDWARLGEYVRHRRDKELGMTQLEVQAAGGPSTATMRLIEGGHQTKGYTPMTITALETSMGWAKGSVAKILRGGKPDLAPAESEPEPEPPPEPEPEDPLVAELMARDEGLTHEGAVAAAVIIRAYRKQGNSPDQSKKQA